jgi:uncharacterized protein GlcG (DUF336 family)
MTSTITWAGADKAIEAGRAKARTSVLFAAPTKDLAGAVQPGSPMFGIESGFRDAVAFVGGGVPVTDSEGRLIGAIGVGGGYPDQDNEIAVAVGHAL